MNAMFRHFTNTGAIVLLTISTCQLAHGQVISKQQLQLPAEKVATPVVVQTQSPVVAPSAFQTESSVVSAPCSTCQAEPQVVAAPMSVCQTGNCSTGTCATACSCNSSRFRFNFSALDVTRSTRSNVNGLNVLQGPNAGIFSLAGAEFDRETGYRVGGGIGIGDWDVGFNYTDFGDFNIFRSGRLTSGVSFDAGADAGNPWAGSNRIGPSSIFSPIYEASAGGNAADEFDGLGPAVAAFTTDALPTYWENYDSTIRTTEINLMPRNYMPGCRKTGGWRMGAGFVHTDVDEHLTARLGGTFRARDIGGVFSNGGLLHSDLTDAAEGNLNLISGNANGFSDQAGDHPNDGNPLIADDLLFTHDIDVDNNLNGVQLLLDNILYRNCRFRLIANTRFGLYENTVNSTISQRYRDEDSVYGRDFVREERGLALSFGAAIGAEYQIRRHLSFNLGYEMNYLSGLALAPDQTINNGGYQIDRDGDILLHGIRGGFGIRF